MKGCQEDGKNLSNSVYATGNGETQDENMEDVEKELYKDVPRAKAPKVPRDKGDPCKSCGRFGHDQTTCYVFRKQLTCHACNRKGNLRVCCRAAKRGVNLQIITRTGQSLE
eukprot:GHVP01057971.1.p1 GENE.GHVP01057971.1~~GHVP01057971.1.p1  ORF type:complete len:111 (+),score=12.95 GHVP01057971.1:385-717(+)